MGKQNGDINYSFLIKQSSICHRTKDVQKVWIYLLKRFLGVLLEGA